jgi:hypothetical protein
MSRKEKKMAAANRPPMPRAVHRDRRLSGVVKRLAGWPKALKPSGRFKIQLNTTLSTINGAEILRYLPQNFHPVLLKILRMTIIKPMPANSSHRDMKGTVVMNTTELKMSMVGEKFESTPRLTDMA